MSETAPKKFEPKYVEGTTIPIAPHISGAVYDATVAGFVRMIAEANIATTQGWQLTHFTRLEKSLAALYRRSGVGAPTSFFEPEDEDL